MKKYIKPSIEIVKIETENLLLQASKQLSSDPVTEESSILSRPEASSPYSIWGADEEE